MSARALFKSMERPSEINPHDSVYPFTLKPEKWYTALKSSLPESSDELRYRKSGLRAQQALMNATKIDLSDSTNNNIKKTQELIEQNLKQLNQLIQNAVDKLLQMEVECFSHANVSVCGDIINGHTAFRFLLQNVSEHFAQQEYLQSIIDSRDQSIIVLEQKLREVEAKIKIISQQIKAAERREIGVTVDESTGQTTVVTSCPEAGKIHFTFHSQNTDASSECNSESDDTQDTQEYCRDDRLPVNATNQQLWNLRSCSVDNELKSFQVYANFTSLMNSATAKLSATLLRVDIHRSWLDLSMFEDFNHFTMKQGRGIVSPGPLEPASYFKQVAESGRYLMPQYTSSFILASDVSIFYPELGAWNDTDDDDNVNGVVHILMKYAFAPNLAGGFGPFSFAPADDTQTDQHNFRVERKSGGVLITVPGAQIIGYVTTVVPRFPFNQTDPSEQVQCKPKPSEQHKRRKRSVMEDSNDIPTIKELANSLFVETFERSSLKYAKTLESVPTKEFIQIQAFEKLMQDSDATKERVEKFIEKLEIKEDLHATILPVVQDRSSVYLNDTPHQQIKSKPH